MTSKQWVAARRLVQLPCALLMGVLAAPAQAAEEASAWPADATDPVEQLTELDEVRVRGKLVANAVIRTENHLFRLYNNLNKDNRYDVHCRDLRQVRDTLSMLRICLPEFAGSYTPPRYYPTSFSSRGFGITSGCGGMSANVDDNGNTYYYMSSCPTLSGFSTSGSYLPPYYGNASMAAEVASNPVVLPADKRAEFAQNMVRILNSDPALQDVATELAGMYREVDRIQARYAALREEKREASKARMKAARERGRELRPPYPRAL